MSDSLRVNTEERKLLLEQTAYQQNGRSHQHMQSAVKDILQLLGEDIHREGLIDTPKRVSKMLGELTAGYHVELDKLVNNAVFASNYDESVIVKDIEFHSLCEHHMLPFYGVVHCAYIPDGQVIGLSKIPRIVEMYARRLQIQEAMTEQIAQTIEQVIAPKGVAVRIEGVHMCSVMRGVEKKNASMRTQIMLGEFKNDQKRRDEFFELIG